MKVLKLIVVLAHITLPLLGQVVQPPSEYDPECKKAPRPTFILQLAQFPRKQLQLHFGLYEVARPFHRISGGLARLTADIYYKKTSARPTSPPPHDPKNLNVGDHSAYFNCNAVKGRWELDSESIYYSKVFQLGMEKFWCGLYYQTKTGKVTGDCDAIETKILNNAFAISERNRVFERYFVDPKYDEFFSLQYYEDAHYEEHSFGSSRSSIMAEDAVRGITTTGYRTRRMEFASQSAFQLNEISDRVYAATYGNGIQTYGNWLLKRSFRLTSPSASYFHYMDSGGVFRRTTTLGTGRAAINFNIALSAPNSSQTFNFQSGSPGGSIIDLGEWRLDEFDIAAKAPVVKVWDNYVTSKISGYVNYFWPDVKVGPNRFDYGNNF